MQTRYYADRQLNKHQIERLAKKMKISRDMRISL